MVVVQILLILFAVYAAYHMWQNTNYATPLKVIIAIAIVAFGIVGAIAWFAIYYLVIKKKEAEQMQQIQQQQQAYNQAQQPYSMPSVPGSPEAAAPAAEQQTQGPDEDDMRFDRAMAGPGGEKLQEAYKKLHRIFVLTENNDVKGSMSGLLYSEDRCKRLQKMDNDIVFPILGSDPDTYHSWWYIFYNRCMLDILNGRNEAEAELFKLVLQDVGQGDHFMEISTAKERILSGQVSELELSSPQKTVKIKRMETKGRVWYRINGVWQFFKGGLDLDPLIRMAQMLIFTATYVNTKGEIKYLEHKTVMEYDIPALRKVGR